MTISPSAGATAGEAGHPHHPAAPRITVGTNPVGVILDPSTGTLYAATVDGISLVDVRRCTARVTAGCEQVVRTLPIGGNDIGIVLDAAHRTVYFSSADDGFVGVLNAATCSIADESGCAAVARVPVGAFPTGIVLDPAHDTLYVPNSKDDGTGDTMSMIDTARCNGAAAAGCAVTGTFVAGGGVQQGFVDQATHTLYTANGTDDDVALFDTATCNARRTGGCAPLSTIAVDGSPVDVRVSRRTLYVDLFAAAGAGLLTMVDTGGCRAGRTFTCAGPHRTAPVGSNPMGLTEDPTTGTLYAESQEDSSVAVVDEARCNAFRIDGCRVHPFFLRGDFDAGWSTVDPQTHTVYYASQDQNTITVLDGSTCNAQVSSGCDHAVPTVAAGDGPSGLVIDAPTHTLYVADDEGGTVSVLDARRCAAPLRSGCGVVATVTVGDTDATPKAVGIDESTHTAYVANYGAGTITLFDTRTCNAGVRTGCTTTWTVPLPGGAYWLVVDPATHTVYAVEFDDGTLSILDGRHCNAGDRSGCAGAVTTVPAGQAPANLQLDPATHTLYVTDRTAGTVLLADTATCRAGNTADCTIRASAPVGGQPRFMTEEQPSHTLYVANRLDGTLSLLDTRTCNVGVTTGCAAHHPTVTVGDLPYGLAVDSRTRTLFVGNVGDSTVSRLSAARCNADVQTGCERQRTIGVGGWPTNVVVDPQSGTVFVSDNVDRTVSVFAGRR